MATRQLNGFLRLVRTAMLVHEAGGANDAQLLEAFVAQKDEAAFATLVRRHGAMVWGVCRRVVGHVQDAEDAFQATFLVLVRKASTIMPRALVGNWLYGVAYRTALKARATAARRRAVERQVDVLPEAHAAAKDAWPDLRKLLDQELECLPRNYRAAIVLCDLEGKTHKEAARQMGWPVGTLSTRLQRARALLAKRLARRGVGLSAGGVAILLCEQVAQASLPVAVLSSTIQAGTIHAAGPAAGVLSARVAELTEAMLKAMLLAKLKITVALVLAVGIVGSGTGLLTYQRLAAQPADKQEEATAKLRPQPDSRSKHNLEAANANVKAAEAQLRLAEANYAQAKANYEVAKASAGIAKVQAQRQLRWRILFDTQNGKDYADQLEALGAMLAIPSEDQAKYDVIHDLSQRPVKPSVENLSKTQHIFWIDSDPHSVAPLSEALGLKQAPQAFVVFLPRYIEDELLRKELAYAKQKEEDIQETSFKFYRSKTGFQIKVASQSNKQ